MIVEIRHKGNLYEFKIDEDDYDFYKQHKWHYYNRGYLRTFKKGSKNKFLLYHREVMKCPPDKIIDHMDGDTTNNQKENLRICTYQENARNTRKKKNMSNRFKGVHYCPNKNRWRAQITVDGKRKHIGYYRNDKLAATAYNEYAKELFGEFAYINEIDEFEDVPDLAFHKKDQKKR